MSLTFRPLHGAKKDTSVGRSTSEFYGHKPTLFLNNLFGFTLPLYFRGKNWGCVLSRSAFTSSFFFFTLPSSWAHFLSPAKICGLKVYELVIFRQCMPWIKNKATQEKKKDVPIVYCWICRRWKARGEIRSQLCCGDNPTWHYWQKHKQQQQEPFQGKYWWKKNKNFDDQIQTTEKWCQTAELSWLGVCNAYFFF